MFLNSDWTLIDNFQWLVCICFCFLFFDFIHFKMSIILNFLWYICSATVAITIETTLFIAVNKCFILVRRDIHIILSVFIQIIYFIKAFICLPYFINIICCITCRFFIIQFCLKCDFIIYERIIKDFKIYKYVSYLWSNRKIRKFSQPMNSESFIYTDW